MFRPLTTDGFLTQHSNPHVEDAREGEGEGEGEADLDGGMDARPGRRGVEGGLVDSGVGRALTRIPKGHVEQQQRRRQKTSARTEDDGRPSSLSPGMGGGGGGAKAVMGRNTMNATNAAR